MKQKSAFVLATIVLFATSTAVYAEDSSPAGAMQGPRMQMHQVMSSDRMQLHGTLQQNREDFKASMSAMRAQMQAKFQAERAAFKTKVAGIKDQKKQTVVTTVTDRFTTINTNQTTRMSQSLTKLGAILDKLSTQAANLKSSGKDTTTVDADITSAHTAISTAQAAVANQTANQYIPQITDDTTLRQNVTTTFTQLKTDLETTHKTIQSAKDAVLTVATDLTKLSSTTQ